MVHVNDDVIGESVNHIYCMLSIFDDIHLEVNMF
jgi:hypothetical protein